MSFRFLGDAHYHSEICEVYQRKMSVTHRRPGRALTSHISGPHPPMWEHLKRSFLFAFPPPQGSDFVRSGSFKFSCTVKMRFDYIYIFSDFSRLEFDPE